MHEDREQSKEEKAAATLKEVYQHADEQNTDTATQPDSSEVNKERQGSDADQDQQVGKDDQPTADEAAEQQQGSDADKGI